MLGGSLRVIHHPGSEAPHHRILRGKDPLCASPTPHRKPQQNPVGAHGDDKKNNRLEGSSGLEFDEFRS